MSPSRLAERRVRAWIATCIGAASFGLFGGGCARGCTSSREPIHLNPSMDYQPRYDPQSESAFFYDGSSMRAPVPGTIARGELHLDRALQTGKDAADAFVKTNPAGTDEALVARGRDRFAIYCAPCHDSRGRGKGILYERANVPTPSMHSEKIVNMPDGQLFDVITNGSGLMPSYRWPIPTHDRWAIVAFVRELERQESP
ncbi:MAG: cytochrome c [bacterium]